MALSDTQSAAQSAAIAQVAAAQAKAYEMFASESQDFSDQAATYASNAEASATQASEFATLAQNFAENPITLVATYASLPSSPLGLYLVLADETHDSAPEIYLFTSTNQYWIAMVQVA